MRVRRARAARVSSAGVLLVAAVALAASSSSGGRHHSPRVTETGIHKIKHVVVIMQENRSFDEYFGTFPGADGLPRDATGFTTCLPDPASSTCQRPYHDANDVNGGAAHGAPNSTAAVDGGKMDGFVTVARREPTTYRAAWTCSSCLLVQAGLSRMRVRTPYEREIPADCRRMPRR